MFMNLENRKTSDLANVMLSLTNKVDFKGGD